jgi:competence protein ComEA
MLIIRKFILALSLLAPALVFAGTPVDINIADAATLAEAIKGVGPAKAQAIVAYREKHGPFKSVDDLTLVSGIGTKTIENNRDNLTVGVSEATEAAPSAQ